VQLKLNLGFLRQVVWTDSGGPALSLWQLLSVCHGHQSNDPRDKIFALLNIAADRHDLGIEVDYSATASEVYTRTAARILERSQSLDILTAVSWKKALSLPSWVPDWTKRPDSVPLSFLKLPSPSNLSPRDRERKKNRYYYNAGGDNKVDIQVVIQQCRLTVRGGLIDRVTYVSSQVLLTRMMDNMGWKQWLQVNQQYCKGIPSYFTGEAIEDVFWTTLVGGKTDAEAEATPEYRKQYQAFVDAAADGFTSIRTSPSSNSRSEMSRLYERRQLVQDFGIALMHTADHRSWCVTKSGLMGMVPAETLKGDVICVPLGAQVPFVLREDGSNYRLVGECYIHGVMKGEALNFADFKARDIIIV
jgi:hypothetical protein